MISPIRKRSQTGFSLVELMIVVAIIGILAALAVPKFQSFQAKARQAEAKNNLSHIYTLEMSYYGDNDEYATVNKIGVDNNCKGTNAIGFRVTPCSKVRYNYAATPTNGNQQFTATASAGANKKIVSGCDLTDTWVIDQDKDLKPTIDAVAKCE